MRVSSLLVVFAFAWIFPAVLRADDWPLATSDLPVHPALHTGVLPNGVRYAVLPNAEPRGRISLRLLVRVGSLHERDDERGLAHFLEHMVFRGTRRHPGGSLTQELQRLGIGEGPDHTAFTHFDHTIYHLELPETSDQMLRRGLEVFREYAEDVTFDPKLIELERGVIVSERDTRDTPGARAGLANFALLFPASRQAARSPIGLVEQIRQFTREQFVAFYDAWYRPERLLVIIVGEVSPPRAAELVNEVFASLAPRGPARDVTFSPSPAASSAPTVSIFTDPGLSGAWCSFQHPFPDPATAATHAGRVTQLHRSLAFAMLGRRVTKLAHGGGGDAFLHPVVEVQTPVPGWSTASFGVGGLIRDWQAFIEQLECEHRRALLHGFTSAELRAAKIAFATSYEEAVRTFATWPSDWLAGQLADAIVDGRAFVTPAEIQRDLAPALEAATLADCRRAFQEAWTTRPPHVFIATTPEFAVNAATVGAALNRSRETAVTPPVDTGELVFAYTDFGEPGPLVRTTQVADLDLTQAEFANGVRLNFKSTSFEADTVEIDVRVGTGRLSQPETQPGLDLFANLMVTHGGLGRHTYEELRDLSAGHRASISFYVDTDALAFRVRTARRDLAFGLQVVAAYLTDAAYRPTALREVQAEIGSMYANLANATGGPISATAARVIAGGDRRFGLPLPAEMDARNVNELTAWVEPQFKSGPIELSIVGDTTWEDAADAVARTLGALRPRDARPSNPAAAKFVPAKPRKAPHVSTTPSHLKQVALARACPMPDPLDVHLERRCRLLALLLNERLRVRLREELGATYGCSVEFVQHDGFPRFNYFMIYSEVAPERSRRAVELITQELDAFRKGRFSNDEFARAKQPFVRSREDDRRSNLYWAHTVLRDSQQRPERLAAARNRSADTAAITRKEIERLAARYLLPQKSFAFVAYPVSTATPPARR